MNQGTVLVVEDDPTLREVLSETLEMANYQVKTAKNGEDALRRLEQNDDISLLVSDVQMEPVDGHKLLKSARSRYPDMPVILMTAYGTVEKAVQAMQDGAVDYLVKPFEADALVDMVARFILPKKSEVDDGLVAVDSRSRELAAVAKRVAMTDATVMISGESGVGKEVISRFIHHHSSRAAGPFVAISCAAIPETMLESVLFGYDKGAFTGAHTSKPGKFEQAQGGTLLLDEITEMDLGLQAKLLRVIQEREVERLGGRKVIPLDVRILATTNRDFKQAVAEGNFREDLFYRLNVFPLTIHPLRDRPEDIMPLANRLLSTYGGHGAEVSFTGAAVNVLQSQAWPGNVRELDNVIQRALILKTGHSIDASDLHFEQVAEYSVPGASLQAVSPAAAQPTEEGLNSDLRDHEKNLIISALKAKTSRREVLAASLGAAHEFGTTM